MRSGEHFAIDVARPGDGGRAVVTISGEIDLAGSPEVARRLREELSAGPVLLDLSGVTYMDSSGVRMIDRLLGDGYDVLITRDLAPAVTQILTLTGMLGVLPFAGAER